MARAAVERFAELRTGERPGRICSRPSATSTSTSASCTRRTARRSMSSAGARRRTSRSRSTRSLTATSSTMGTGDRRGRWTRGDRAAQDAHDRDRAVRRPGRRRPDLLRSPLLPGPGLDDDGAARAYRLLTEVMAQTERAALGRFVMRAKEYLAIVRERDRALTLTTMLFADEVRPTKDIDNAGQKSHKPTAKQLDAAVAVIEELSSDWEPEKYKDRYRARLKRVVDRKRKGETIKAPETPEQPEAAPDLMDALERTLSEMRGDGTASSKRQQPVRNSR